MSEYCMPVAAEQAARFHRTVARMRRVNMRLCTTWVERLIEQMEAEWHEAEAARIEAAVTEHEGARAAMLARGASVDDRFRLVVQDGHLAYAQTAAVRGQLA